MERLDELNRATLVDPLWRPLRGAVVAERRMIAATLVDSVPAASRKIPRTPPAPPPKPPTPRTEIEQSPEPYTDDPLEQLARGRC